MWKWSADSYSSGFWTYNIMVLRQANYFSGLKSKQNLLFFLTDYNFPAIMKMGHILKPILVLRLLLISQNTFGLIISMIVDES